MYSVQMDTYRRRGAKWRGEKEKDRDRDTTETGTETPQ